MPRGSCRRNPSLRPSGHERLELSAAPPASGPGPRRHPRYEATISLPQRDATAQGFSNCRQGALSGNNRSTAPDNSGKSSAGGDGGPPLTRPCGSERAPAVSRGSRAERSRARPPGARRRAAERGDPRRRDPRRDTMGFSKRRKKRIGGLAQRSERFRRISTPTDWTIPSSTGVSL